VIYYPTSILATHTEAYIYIYMHVYIYNIYHIELLKYHPGLEFLSTTQEFQEKYGTTNIISDIDATPHLYIYIYIDISISLAATVAVRIFYVVDSDSSGRITLRKLRRSNVVDAFNTVDEEDDINKVHAYFSYEHFYVLYCKFWELDMDHDFYITRDDLMRYGGHALTRVIVDRIFEYGRRPFARMQLCSADEKTQRMSYEDFICTLSRNAARDSIDRYIDSIYIYIYIYISWRWTRLYAFRRRQGQCREFALLV
jgi:hypothetical protein